MKNVSVELDLNSVSNLMTNFAWYIFANELMPKANLNYVWRAAPNLTPT